MNYIIPQYRLIANFTSLVMDQLDTMIIDEVLVYDPEQVKLILLRRCITRYYNERSFKKGFTLKPALGAHKIWRWK